MADFNGESSDDEVVFSGKMTLKEVKKHIFLNYGKKRTTNITLQEPVDCDSSIKIVEAHSQPNLRNVFNKSSPLPVDSKVNENSDDSILLLEEKVPMLIISPEQEEGLELNNTLEIVEYILNKGPDQGTKEISTEMLDPASLQPNPNIGQEMSSPKKEINSKETLYNWAKSNSKKEMEYKEKNLVPKVNPINELDSPKTSSQAAITKSSPSSTPAKTGEPMNSPKYFTPAKSPRKQPDIFLTPSSVMLKPTTSKLKVPSSTLSEKKPSATSVRSIPCSSNKYKNIRSPIASYIKGSIKVPMISNVYPKKPLPGNSMIPKIIKSSPQIKTQNKENINTPNFVNHQPLPTVIYKTAKKTKIIHVPSKENHRSPSVKKLLPTLPRPPVVILKHEAREFSSAKKKLPKIQDDSVADLSSAQAEVSICTPMKPRNKH